MPNKTIRLTGALSLAATLLGGTAALAQTSGTVAFLMPDQASTRYEEHDFPGFQAEMEKLCPDCQVIYQNANADVALQQQQFNSVLTQGAKVVVLDPVDSSAAASLVRLAQSQDVKMIAYDRPIPDVPADYYVSFDNEAIGKAIAEGLVAHLQETGVSPDAGGVLQINGSPTDAAAGLIRDGIDAGLDNSPYKTLAEYDTPDWAPPRAQQWTSGQIQRFGAEIIGVVAANDGTAGGAIAAFKRSDAVGTRERAEHQTARTLPERYRFAFPGSRRTGADQRQIPTRPIRVHVRQDQPGPCLHQRQSDRAVSAVDLARIAGLSTGAFSRGFRRHTGLALVQFINRLRINFACQLLMEDEALRITDVCFASGFNNLSNFNRQLLKLKGMTPSRFRAHLSDNFASGRPREDEGRELALT